jgi:hypothetical protein
MKIKLHRLRRVTYVALALGLAVGGVAEGWLVQKAYAFPTGGQLVDRSIRISSSATNAPAGSVNYQVSFLPASDYTVEGIIVDFCASTPIIGDASCTLPTGFSVGTPTVNTAPGLTGYTNLTGTWTATALNSGQTLKLENATGVALNDTNATPYTFVLTTATNPTTLGSFYARIITYTSDAGDIDSYAPATEGSTDAEDYGGIALSTVNVVNIQAKVQETLTFCVSEQDPDPNCANTTTPALTLGHGANEILDPTATDTDVAFMQASTNAQSGIVVRMKNSNTCGGLSRDAGATCDILPAGGTAATITPGASALFGMYVTPGSGVTATAPYASGTTQYGMDNTALVGVSSTYGSNIATSAGPLNNIESTMTFGATATNTTPAGLYVANMTIIATGTF